MPTAPQRRDTLAVLFALVFPCFMAWLYFVQMAQTDVRNNPALQIAFAVGKAIQFLFPVLYVWWFERDRLVLRWPTRQGLALGAGFGLLVAGAILGLYFFWLKHCPLLGDTPERIYRKVREFNMATPAGYLQMSFFICVVHSLFEEYYWRWFIFGTLKRYLAVMPAILLASFGFTLHHIVILGVYFPDRFWMLAVPFSLCVGVGGGVWAWIYQRSGSLYAAWLSHALIDAAILFVGYDMVAPYLGPILWDAIDAVPAG